MKERTQNKKEHLIKHRRHEANPLVQITKNWRFNFNTHALYSRRSWVSAIQKSATYRQ